MHSPPLVSFTAWVAQIDKFLYSSEDYVKAGAVLAVGIVSRWAFVMVTEKIVVKSWNWNLVEQSPSRTN